MSDYARLMLPLGTPAPRVISAEVEGEVLLGVADHNGVRVRIIHVLVEEGRAYTGTNTYMCGSLVQERLKADPVAWYQERWVDDRPANEVGIAYERTISRRELGERMLLRFEVES